MDLGWHRLLLGQGGGHCGERTHTVRGAECFLGAGEGPREGEGGGGATRPGWGPGCPGLGAILSTSGGLRESGSWAGSCAVSILPPAKAVFVATPPPLHTLGHSNLWGSLPSRPARDLSRQLAAAGTPRFPSCSQSYFWGCPSPLGHSQCGVPGVGWEGWVGEPLGTAPRPATRPSCAPEEALGEEEPLGRCPLAPLPGVVPWSAKLSPRVASLCLHWQRGFPLARRGHPALAQQGAISFLRVVFPNPGGSIPSLLLLTHLGWAFPS